MRIREGHVVAAAMLVCAVIIGLFFGAGRVERSRAGAQIEQARREAEEAERRRREAIVEEIRHAEEQAASDPARAAPAAAGDSLPGGGP